MNATPQRESDTEAAERFEALVGGEMAAGSDRELAVRDVALKDGHLYGQYLRARYSHRTTS